jgi:hypothetical protein
MTTNDDDYKRGYREGYQDGMDSARKLLDPYLPIAPVLPPFNFTPNLVCKICRRDLKGVSNYVCAISSCPSNVRAVTE